MAEIKKLVTMLKELDDQLVNCMKCGMCQAVCPIFKRTGKEADVTRGKLALVEGLAGEILKDAQGVNDALNRCLLCGTCQANCPSGVQVVDIFLKARAVMTGYFGLSPAKKLIFRRLLSNPNLFNFLTGMAGKFQGMFIKPADRILGSSCARFNAPLVGDRHFKGLAAKPLRKQVSALDEPKGKSGLRVAFFPGCVVDKMFPEVGTASLKALHHHNVGVFMPSGQACCGIPALSSGDRSTFESLVRQNLAKFQAGSFDYLLTPCATCTATIKELWPSMYKGSDADVQALKELAAKTMDISQFLVDVIGVDAQAASSKAPKVTYHDPCHLKNSLGITAQPRKILKANPGYQYVEMAEAGVCCGCGGSFNINHYEMSKEIGTKKAENVIASGADVAATSCPACMMQLTDMLSRQGKGVRVKHVMECYAEMISSGD